MNVAGRDMERFKALLLRACGSHFAEERERTLTGALGQRMRRLDLADPKHYYDLLLADQEELQRLIELLTINETYFFREPECLQLAVDRLIPELMQERGQEDVLIFCVGCASGEEPYSLAMLLDQRMGALSHRVAIAAADIDATAIAAARRGVYGRESFRGGDPAYRDRYFMPHGPDAWQLGDIRHRVQFEVHNLMTDSPPPAGRRPDLIFYRNVSIYFPGPVQREIFSRLAGQLNDGGYLFVGASETMAHDLGILPLIERDSHFFFRKPRHAAPAPGHARPGARMATPASGLPRSSPASRRPSSLPPVRRPATPADNTGKNTAGLQTLFAEALDLARSRNWDQAQDLLDRILTADASFSKAYALKGTILISRDCFPEAQPLCRTALEHDPLCLDAYLLLGISARHQGDNAGAGRHFREALYLNRACWPAHFYLAEIAYADQDRGRARRGYRTALEVLRQQTYPAGADGFFPLSFNAEHFMEICRHKLSLLDGSSN